VYHEVNILVVMTTVRVIVCVRGRCRLTRTLRNMHKVTAKLNILT